MIDAYIQQRQLDGDRKAITARALEIQHKRGGPWGAAVATAEGERIVVQSLNEVMK